MLDILPVEVINLIVTYDNKTWLISCQLSKYFLQFNNQEELKIKFIRKLENHCDWEILYQLPNGDNHNHDEPSISDGNTKFWYQNDQLHRDNDLPAIIYRDGSKKWFQNGLCHRDNDLPAIIYSDGGQAWYQNGKFHRKPRLGLTLDNDLPAVILSNGRRYWYQNDKLIRSN